MWRFKLQFGLMLVLGVCVSGADASCSLMLVYLWVCCVVCYVVVLMVIVYVGVPS